MDKAKKIEILAVAKTELMRHTWNTFVDRPPSIAQGGDGITVAGCALCKKRTSTNEQYLRHLADDVLPVILRKAFAMAQETSS